MKTSHWIWIGGLAALALAGYHESIPAAFVAVFGAIIMKMCHVIEVKLNKLLDAQRIYLTPKDLD